MRNKVALINFPQDLPVELESVIYYQLYYLDLPITDFHLTQFHGIIVLGSGEEFALPEENFFREINIINPREYKNFIQEPLAHLDKFVGRERLVNPRQFEILEGSVVRSKVDHRLRVGVVKEERENNMVLVAFPYAKKIGLKSEILCHKSTLRSVTHIKELIYHEENKLI